MARICFNPVLLHISIFIVCLFNVSLQHVIKKLDLEKGEICRKGQGFGTDYVCMSVEKCKFFMESYTNHDTLDICSFNGLQPIVCCPPLTLKEPLIEAKPTKKYPNLAYKKCHHYAKVARKKSHHHERTRIARSVNQNIHKKIITKIDGNSIPSVFNDALAKPREFPHMAIVGFGKTPEVVRWGCGGSLISERWILTAAHCKIMSDVGKASWARLGDLNIVSTVDDARPEDHRIVQHVLHPDYQPPSLYNDIALFRLETDVEFSTYVIPICLNSDQSLNPTTQIATGWGQISVGGPTSADLLKVELNMIPTTRCNNSYFASNSRQLAFGIVPESMMCAGSTEGGKDTCEGDSGGPLQIKNVHFPGMFTQVGITSFGKFCGDKDSPGVYTRVSKYVSWIEEIVWHKDD